MTRTIKLGTNHCKIVLPDEGDTYWENSTTKEFTTHTEDLLIEKIIELEDHAHNLKKSLTFPLCCTPNTIREAFDYAVKILKAQPDDNPEGPIYIALGVLMNTIASQIYTPEEKSDD